MTTVAVLPELALLLLSLIVAVLPELPLLLLSLMVAGGGEERFSPLILRLYTLDSESALLLKAARFAFERLGDGGTMRTDLALCVRPREYGRDALGG